MLQRELGTVMKISNPPLLGTSVSLCRFKLLFVILPDSGLIVEAGGHTGSKSCLVVVGPFSGNGKRESNGWFMAAVGPRLVEKDNLDFY